MENYNIPGLIKAKLIKRINRFVADVLIDGESESVYVPNTGRLSELALPGADLLLAEISGKYRYKILYIINSSYPVMIDSTYSNKLFHELLLNRKVPTLENYTLVRREPAYKNHRFDFLMKHGGDELFVELKSCTLFHGTIASFPDAVSSRASEHIKLLAETGKGLLVFFILKNGMEKFVPNYHTDFSFYETLRENRQKIRIKALSVQYDVMLKITGLKELPVMIPDVSPRGFFLILIHVQGTVNHEDTENSEISSESYCLLCGNDNENVFRAVKKFRKGKAGFHGNMKIIADIPVISETLTSVDAADTFIKHGGERKAPCEKFTGLETVYFHENPADKKWFWDEILEMRFG